MYISICTGLRLRSDVHTAISQLRRDAVWLSRGRKVLEEPPRYDTLRSEAVIFSGAFLSTEIHGVTFHKTLVLIRKVICNYTSRS
jgi:hypothetical protein